jgi:hypothetical protein
MAGPRNGFEGADSERRRAGEDDAQGRMASFRPPCVGVS